MSRTARAGSSDLTHDAFLGGRLRLWQPRHGYRAGIDPVLLAATVAARGGQRVLDLGCGVGTAMLCLHARVPDLALTGVERDPLAADLARRNAEAAGARATVVTADLTDLPMPLRAETFDHVITNPPYFDRTAGAAAADPGRDLGRGGDVTLETWLDAAIRRVRPGGRLWLVQPVGRLDRVIATLAGRLGSLAVRPLCARESRAPHLALITARHGGRAPFVLAPPLVLHAEPSHMDDRPDYTPCITGILRDGKMLPIAG